MYELLSNEGYICMEFDLQRKKLVFIAYIK